MSSRAYPLLLPLPLAGGGETVGVGLIKLPPPPPEQRRFSKPAPSVVILNEAPPWRGAVKNLLFLDWLYIIQTLYRPLR